MSNVADLSDEELMKIAGIQPSSMSHAISDLSDEELMKIAGIESAPKGFHPTSQEAFEGMPKRLAQTARNAVSGIAGVADIPLLPVTIPMALKGHNPFTFSGAVGDTIDTLTGGYTKPESKGEKVAEAIVQSVAGMKPSAGVGNYLVKNAPAIGNFAKKGAGKAAEYLGKFMRTGNVMTPTNIAGTAGTSGVMQHHMQESNNPVESLLLGALTGTGIQGASNLTKKHGLAASIGELAGINPEKVSKINKAGLGDVKTLADVGNKGSKILQNVTGNIPFTDKKLEEIYQKRPEAVMKALGIKQPMTNAELSQLSKDTVSNIESKYSKQANALKSKFEESLTTPIQKEVPVDSSIQYLMNKRGKLKTKTALNDFDSSKEGIFLNKLINMSEETGNGKVPFNDLENFRRQVGNAAFPSITVAIDYDKGALQGLYKHINKDLSTHFSSLGDEVSQSWHDYNKHWSEYKKNIQPHLTDLERSQKRSNIGIFNTLYSNTKKGGEKSNILLENLPKGEDKDKFVSSMFYELGLDNQSQFSPKEWAKNWRNLQPEVQDVLLSYYGPAKSTKVKSILDSIDLMKDTSGEAVSKGASGQNKLFEIVGKTGAIAYGGSLLGPVKTMMGWAGTWGLNHHLMGNPKFIDAAAYGIKIKNRAQIPIWLNKLENVPGMPKEALQKAKKIYHNALKEDISHGHGAFKKSLSRGLIQTPGLEKRRE